MTTSGRMGGQKEAGDEKIFASCVLEALNCAACSKILFCSKC